MTKRAKEHKMLVRIQMNNKEFFRGGQRIDAELGFRSCFTSPRWRQRRRLAKKKGVSA